LGFLKHGSGCVPNNGEILTEEVYLMYAVLVTGGKQYKVSEGDVLYVEKLEAEVDSNVDFDNILMVSKEDGELVVGKPVVDGANVSAKVLAQGKNKKIIVFKYKRKKDYRRKAGHRQPYTKIQIEKINA
jgi:large subunit ribosomal protein L21